MRRGPRPLSRTGMETSAGKTQNVAVRSARGGKAERFPSPGRSAATQGPHHSRSRDEPRLAAPSRLGALRVTPPPDGATPRSSQHRRGAEARSPLNGLGDAPPPAMPKVRPKRRALQRSPTAARPVHRGPALAAHTRGFVESPSLLRRPPAVRTGARASLRTAASLPGCARRRSSPDHTPQRSRGKYRCRGSH